MKGYLEIYMSINRDYPVIQNEFMTKRAKSYFSSITFFKHLPPDFSCHQLTIYFKVLKQDMLCDCNYFLSILIYAALPNSDFSLSSLISPDEVCPVQGELR